MAEETFELYSLTSKLTLDASQFDRVYGESQKKTRSLSGDLRKLEQQQKQTASGFNNDLGSALSAISPRLAALGSSGVGGLAIAGLSGILTAITALSAGVWDITTKFADMGGELKDLSQQVNFSVETLSGLSHIGKTAGTDIQALSSSLVIFQKNLAKGDDAFKLLGVTSRDNEEALRQTFKALNDIDDATIQTALAAEVFGKSGKNMLGVIKEVNGDLDPVMDKMRKWGLIMSIDDAEAADEFGDRLDILSMRARGIANQIASETTPAFTAFFVAIDSALDANETDWKWWGEQIAKVILTVETALGGLAYAIKNIDFSPLGPLQFLMDFNTGANKTADVLVPEYWKRTHPTVSDPGQLLSPGLRSGSGIRLGSDKKDKASRTQEDPIIRLMERYQAQLANLTPRTEEQRVQEELLGKEYAKSSDAQKELVLGIARAIDVKKRIIEASDKQTKQQKLEASALEAFMSKQEEALRQIKFGDKTAVDEFNDFRVAFDKLGGVLTKTQEHWLRFDAMLILANEHAKQLHESLMDIATTTPPIAPGGVPEYDPSHVFDDSTLGLPPPEDPMAKWRRVADDLASDITYTIDSAISEGFRHGIKAGIIEFGLGILEMARHAALQQLEKAIANVLSGGGSQGQGQGSGGGGGGLFGTIINFGLSALGGTFGGGSSAGGAGSAAAGAIGKFAGGGFMYPNEWAWVGERGPELVKAGSRGASVMANSESMALAGGGGWTMNVYANDAQSFTSRRTQTQIKRSLNKIQRGY